MALLLHFANKDPAPWIEALKAVDSNVDIRIWPDDGTPEDIVFCLSWSHPPGALLPYKNLRCISSAGAGVDHILNDPGRPPDVPVTRIFDPLLRRSLMLYVVHAVLDHFQDADRYRYHQSRKRWQQESPPHPDATRIGVMGLGQMGRTTAMHLANLGFKVAGWSRTPKRLDDIECFLGEREFPYFLAGLDMLICMLPLTPWTKDILNIDTFRCLNKGAYLINVGRGGHLVEADLLQALHEEQLSGACLDVFQTEPLPPYHQFWGHPQIRITPHVASLTDPKSVAPQIMANYRRAATGETLMNLIDTELWY